MDTKKYCKQCGDENFSAKSVFCCEKCKQRFYYLQNKEKRKEYKKEYYQTHKEECDARRNKWIEEHREQWNEYYRNRRKGEKDNG